MTLGFLQLCCQEEATSAHQRYIFFYRYFLLCVNYFFYGETVTDYFFTLVQREEPLRILSKYHRFISFTLYLTGKCFPSFMTVLLSAYPGGVGRASQCDF